MFSRIELSRIISAHNEFLLKSSFSCILYLPCWEPVSKQARFPWCHSRQEPLVNLWSTIIVALFPQRTIAIIPFATYVAGLICSFGAKPISARFGSRVGIENFFGIDSNYLHPQWVLISGTIFGIISCAWILIGNNSDAYKLWQIYGVSAFIGIGGTALLISSLALTSDLIGSNTVRLWSLCGFVWCSGLSGDRSLRLRCDEFLRQISQWRCDRTPGTLHPEVEWSFFTITDRLLQMDSYIHYWRLFDSYLHWSADNNQDQVRRQNVQGEHHGQHALAGLWFHLYHCHHSHLVVI